jgi:hypothetical protein
MKVEVGQAVEVLAKTPAVLRGLLEGVSDGWTRSNYGPETFSPFDVVGHLIHGERTDWMPRLRIILEHGEARPFKPFDRYAMYEASKGKTVGQLLDDFERLRMENLRQLRGLGLTDKHFALPGMHPALGRVTLGQLLATWVVHDLGHLRQVARVMAGRYRDEVGPWAAYLPVLAERGSVGRK